MNYFYLTPSPLQMERGGVNDINNLDDVGVRYHDNQQMS